MAKKNGNPLKSPICSPTKGISETATIRKHTVTRPCRGGIKWVCAKHEENTKSCNSNYYSEERIYDGFLSVVNKLRFGQENILGQVIAKLESATHKYKRNNKTAMQISQKIAEINATILKLNELRSKGYLAPEIHQSQVREMQKQLCTLKEDRQDQFESRILTMLQDVRKLKSLIDEIEEPLDEFDEKLFEEINMNTEKQIENFNNANAPFYVVAHDDGRFSLCLPIALLSDEYYPYCQTAFDNYAKEIGDEMCDERGLKTHGNGYEWDAAFREAFADEPNIGRIIFDSEAGGFFCNCDDLQILTGFGSRFKKICENTEVFTKTIAEGIKNADEREAEQERFAKTVRGQLMRHPECSFDIMTADGRVQLTPEDIKAMLSGEKQDIRIDGVIYAAYELLDMEVVDMQADLFDNGLLRMKAECRRCD